MRKITVECVPDIEVLGIRSFDTDDMIHMESIRRGDYTVHITSNWYKPLTKRLSVGRVDTTFNAELNYKDLIDCNRDETDIGEWLENADIIIDGGAE